MLNKEHSKGTLLNSNEVLQMLGPGENPTLYLLLNGWLQRILQKTVTSSAIGSSKLLTNLLADSRFSMQRLPRVNLWKHASYHPSLNSFLKFEEYFDVTMPSGCFYKTHFTLYPRLQEYIASFKSASQSATADIVKQGRGTGGKPNIPAAELNIQHWI